MRRGPVQTDGTTIETRDDGSQVISGMAAVFHRSDDPGTEFQLMDGVVERVAPSAFTSSLERGDDVRGLVNHDPNIVLGRTKSGTMTLSQTKRGLRYEIPYDEHDPDHRSIKRKLEKGDISGSSFGFRVTGETWEERDDGMDVRTITDVELLDVSPVTYPAYKSTSSGVRSDDLAEVRSARENWRSESSETPQEPTGDEIAELRAQVEFLQIQVETLEARVYGEL
jgi:HK97 family phage prohead protease